MIRVARDQPGDDGLPTQPGAEWLADAVAATDEALEEGAAHAPRDGVYGADAVRAALEALFRDKCAYCETRATASSDWDVEHFRPKGRVAERADHTGYYWLAYTWTNLYLSCQHCNQRRRDKPRYGDTTLGIVSGKLDQFPLADEASRAMAPGSDVAAERRLLLDPCVDEPEDDLTVSVTGKLLARGNSLRARTSIGVFGLNRRRLIDARREHIRVILEVIRRTPGQRDVIRDVVLDVFAEPRGVYALVARAMRRRPAAFDL